MPELDEAIDFIQYCVTKGIVVGIGHHNASVEQIQHAVEHGVARKVLLALLAQKPWGYFDDVEVVLLAGDILTNR